MTQYKVETPKVEEYGFTKSGIYMERATYKINGRPVQKLTVKTYSNKTQADNKVAQLTAKGVDTFRSFDWPFTIHRVSAENAHTEKTLNVE